MARRHGVLQAAARPSASPPASHVKGEAMLLLQDGRTDEPFYVGDLNFFVRKCEHFGQ
jgi:hypothetical protein